MIEWKTMLFVFENGSNEPFVIHALGYCKSMFGILIEHRFQQFQEKYSAFRWRLIRLRNDGMT